MFVDISDFLKKLEGIYQSVDEEYNKVTTHYSFSCEGCSDLCCEYPFFHFTLLEHLYLIEGFRGLPEKRKIQIIQRAYQYNSAYARTSRAEENFKMACPLLEDKKCILYEYRPIICRLYGVPGYLKRGESVLYFDACPAFKKRYEKADLKLDRTPFYTSLANLETELRRKLSYYQKYKKTVAQMIIDEDRESVLVMRGYDIFEGY